MRQIKFRAWDTSGRVILYLTFSQSPLGYIHKFVNYEWGVKGLMQFTGLYDKYGKEIYEGDILEYEYNLDTTTKTKFTEAVEWVDMLEYSGFIIHKNMGIEVIGNIYENPELLK